LVNIIWGTISKLLVLEKNNQKLGVTVNNTSLENWKRMIVFKDKVVNATETLTQLLGPGSNLDECDQLKNIDIIS
jgi:hypothetical protein